MITVVRSNLAQDVCPNDAVFVARPQDALVVYPDEAVASGIWVFEQATASEHEAPETFRCARGVRCQGIPICLNDIPGTVYCCRPGMSQDYLWMAVECINAA